MSPVEAAEGIRVGVGCCFLGVRPRLLAASSFAWLRIWKMLSCSFLLRPLLGANPTRKTPHLRRKHRRGEMFWPVASAAGLDPSGAA